MRCTTNGASCGPISCANRRGRTRSSFCRSPRWNSTARICRSRSIPCWARPSPPARPRRSQAKGQAVVVLPVLWTGLSEHHMSFGGTITLDNAAFAAVVEGVVRSVLRHGFRRIVLLNAHGGNENALAQHHRRSDAEAGRADRAVHLLVRRRRRRSPRSWRPRAGCRTPARRRPSMMMAVRPDLVAEDRIPLAKSNTTPDVSDVVGGGVYTWRSIGSRSASRRDRQPRGRDDGEGRAAVRRDLHRPGGQVVQRGTVGPAVDRRR